MAFEHEERVRILTKAISEEKDPARLKLLAAELEHLLSLEKPWPIINQKLRNG